MGTGVPHKRIVTGNIFGLYTLKTEHKIYYSLSLAFCQYLFFTFLLFFVFIFFIFLCFPFYLGQALGLLVLVSSIHYCTYTSNLSTSLSSRDLTHLRFGISYLEGGFTLRCLQRLSRPYLATQLCSRSATGTPVVCPFRSSRTKNSSSQISCAHNG